MKVSQLTERLNEMGVAREVYSINSVEYPNEASQTIRENEEQLKSIKKCGGQSSENGLWDEIRRYKKLFISKFGIII